MSTGKRKGGILKRVVNAVLGTPPPTSQEGYISHDHNVAQWGGKYNDTPLEGDRYVNGKACKTVGEYKAALAENNNDMNGWSG